MNEESPYLDPRNREKNLEKRLVKRVKELKGKCIKMDVKSESGLPDRMCLMPGGSMFFVELKSYKQKPRPIQEYQIKQLRRRGFTVFVIDNYKDLEALFDETK